MEVARASLTAAPRSGSPEPRVLLEQAARTIRNRQDASADELALEVHAAASLLVALQQASRSCGVRVPQRVSVQRLRHWALMLGSQPDVPSVGGHAR
jgi:hypothetical protein